MLQKIQDEESIKRGVAELDGRTLHKDLLNVQAGLDAVRCGGLSKLSAINIRVCLLHEREVFALTAADFHYLFAF